MSPHLSVSFSNGQFIVYSDGQPTFSTSDEALVTYYLENA